MLSVKNFFLDAGAGWVLWLLFALSIGSVAVAVERFFFFRTKSDDLRGLVGTLDVHLRNGERTAALAELARLRSVGARVASAGLRLSDRGARSAEKGMESALAIERKLLEARLAFLGTLGNNAPFLGLLGTVIGVILAFDALGDPSAGGGAGASQVASAAVMSAIAEALVATAVGIAVALPAVAFNNYFHRRIADILSDAQALSCLVVAYLEEGSSEREGEGDTNARIFSNNRKAGANGSRLTEARETLAGGAA